MKNIIITGANSGIGKTAAIQFAKQGYRVIMACRNMEISMPVCQEIREKSQNSNVEMIQLDISSKQSIYTFCDEYKKKYDVLDVLINNAGHFKHGETSFQQSIDGLELTIATNLLGPVLLIHLLLDVLRKSSRPVVLNACSTNIKHFFDDRRKIDFRSLCGEIVSGKKYDSYHLYGDSKMGLLIATFTMAQEYKNDGICVNAIMIPATKMLKVRLKSLNHIGGFLLICKTPLFQKQKLSEMPIFQSVQIGAITG